MDIERLNKMLSKRIKIVEMEAHVNVKCDMPEFTVTGYGIVVDGEIVKSVWSDAVSAFGAAVEIEDRLFAKGGFDESAEDDLRNLGSKM